MSDERISDERLNNLDRWARDLGSDWSNDVPPPNRVEVYALLAAYRARDEGDEKLLRQALREYGHHRDWCNVVKNLFTFDHPSCNCGLGPALATGNDAPPAAPADEET